MILAVAGAGYGIVHRASDSSSSSSEAGKRAQPKPSKAAKRRTSRRRSYLERRGDTLSAIAQRTGVSTGRLQQLNPDIDSQALQPGQRLKLRS